MSILAAGKRVCPHQLMGSSQFDKNDKYVRALSARNNVPNKEIGARRQKNETLHFALRNVSDSSGKTDRRKQSWNAEANLNDMEWELDANTAAREESDVNYGRTGDVLEGMDWEMDDVNPLLIQPKLFQRNNPPLLVLAFCRNSTVTVIH